MTSKTEKTQARQGVVGNTGVPPPTTGARNWFFTVNNYDEKIIKQIEKLKNCSYAFQEEIGESGTKHLQGVLLWKSVRKFDYMKRMIPSAHWEYVKYKKNAIEYCTDIDKRDGRVWTNMKNINIKYSIYDKFETFIKAGVLYSWQQQILKIIKSNPDDRKVFWYWDSKGGIGKSILARHLVLKHNALCIGGSAKDIYYAISEWCKKRELKIVVLDIPRSKYNSISYEAIEKIKDGMFFSGKYESGMCVFNVPHVIVFANYGPVETMMSKDRWCICPI